jgi:hypothetical protein
MISLPKLIEIALVILAVWFAVRWLNRPPVSPRRARQAQRPEPQATRRVEAEDLVACPACGAYVSESARSCGKSVCPRPR